MLQENRGYAEVGSFLPTYSTEFGYGLGPDTLLQNPPRMESDVGEKPKILLMGLRRSGKSSIQKVVFHKMAPNETLFLESTHKIEKNDVSECSFIKFQIWDFPGHVNFCDEMFRSDEIFLASCAIIFIVDAQDDYHEALCYLHTTLETAFRHNTNIKFEVFIHKVDCLNDDQKIDIQRDITQRVTSAVEDLLSEHGAAGGISIGFHLTTIYDHSIFEAFSKVVQKLIPHLDAFEHLLNIFIAKSMVDKAFLFDVTSKIYLATDSSGVDMQTYELCCDMIDVVVDMAAIYTPRSDLADTAFSEPTGATITLNNDRVLYLRGVNQYMALACIIHEESLEKIGLIEYNFHVIKDGLQKMLELNQRHEKDDTEAAARCINSEHPPDRALIAGDENDLEDEDENENEDNHGDPNRPSVRRSRDLGPLLH